MGRKVMKGGFEMPLVPFILIITLFIVAIVILSLFVGGVFNPSNSSGPPPALPYGGGGSGEETNVTLVINRAEFANPADLTTLTVTYTTFGSCSDCAVSLSAVVDGKSSTAQTFPVSGTASNTVKLTAQGVHAPSAYDGKDQVVMPASVVTVTGAVMSNGVPVGPQVTLNYPIVVPVIQRTKPAA